MGIYKKYTVEDAIEHIKVAPAVMGVSNCRLLFSAQKAVAAEKLSASLYTRVTASLPVMLYRFDVCEALQKALDTWSVAFPGQTAYVELAIDSDGVVWVERGNIGF